MTPDVLLTAVSRSPCIFWAKTYNCIKVISGFHPKKKQSVCPKFWLTTWFESSQAPEQAARAAGFAQGAEITLWLQLKTLRPKKVCVWTSGSCSHFNTHRRTYGVLDSSKSSFTWQSTVWHHPAALSHILALFSSSQTFGSHKQTAAFVSTGWGGSLGNALHHPSHGEHPAFSSPSSQQGLEF